MKSKTMLASLIILSASLLMAAVPAPENAGITKVSYSKISLKWSAPESQVQIGGYRIYCNGLLLATVQETEYTDTGIEPGSRRQYVIKTVSLGGEESETASILDAFTLKSAVYPGSGQVEKFVDSQHEKDISATSGVILLAAVRSGIEAVCGDSGVASDMDINTVAGFIDSELAFMRKPATNVSDDVADLQAVSRSFGNNSLDHIYLNFALTTLADSHFQNGKPEAAGMLADGALFFVKDHEPSVAYAVSRLSEYSGRAVPGANAAALAAATCAMKSQSMRFFEFFPDSRSAAAQAICIIPLRGHIKRFPVLLSYEDYHAEVLASARKLSEKLTAVSSDPVLASKMKTLVDGWNVVDLSISLDGLSTAAGTVKVRNMSALSGDPATWGTKPVFEEREFAIIKGKAVIPVHEGHSYKFDFSVDMPGGEPLTFSLENPSVRSGVKTIAGPCMPSAAQTASAKAGSELQLAVPATPFPYNLTAEKNVDVFTLRWSWRNNSSFVPVAYKVMRGRTELMRVYGTEAANIPLCHDDGICDYSVVALAANGSESPASPVLQVIPGDMTRHAEFLAWLERHFPGTKMYSTDDPDGDGVNNYQEFLKGTDPAKAKAPMPEPIEIGYSKLSLRLPPTAGELRGYWMIERDGNFKIEYDGSVFTDGGLNSGISYKYRIKRLAPVESDWSDELIVQMRAAEKFNHAAELQQIVDDAVNGNPEALTGESLVESAKSATGKITGKEVIFNFIDEALLKQLVDIELNFIRKADTSADSATREALQAELKAFLQENFSGISLEHIYMSSLLEDLAHMHWKRYYQNRDRESDLLAFEALNKLALEFMSKDRMSVFNNLLQTGKMRMALLTQDASAAQRAAALRKFNSSMLEYYKYFSPDSVDLPITDPHLFIVQESFKNFPYVLDYDVYDREIFNTVTNSAKLLFSANYFAPYADRWRERVAAWAPVEVLASVSGSSGSGRVSGSLTVLNVGNKTELYVCEPGKPDERTFEVNGTPLNFMAYAGHTYSLTFEIPVPGGPAWRYATPALQFSNGRKIKFSPFANPVYSESGVREASEFEFYFKLPGHPYNLSAERYPDVFNLSWDNSEEMTGIVKHYKVYRGETPVAVAPGRSCTGLPRTVNADNSYLYSVSAVLADGSETRRSPGILVEPDFTEEERLYFEWHRKYFGDAQMPSTADPDGDGLSNYQEFLLGSNPLVAPPASIPDEIERTSGVRIDYYEGKWPTLPDFSTLTPYKSENAGSFCFASTREEVLNSGRTKDVALTVNGLFEVPATGIYNFYMRNADGCVFYIDGAPVLSNDRSASQQEYMAKARLTEGTHMFRVEYTNASEFGRLELWWSGESFARRYFDTGVLWHTDSADEGFAEYLKWRIDSDGDGVADSLELKLGTDRNRKDSDGDGLDDGDELYRTHTDPLKRDTNGNGVSDLDENAINGGEFSDDSGYVGFTLLEERKGADVSRVSGSWLAENGIIVNSGYRGAAEYDFEIGQSGVYKFDIVLGDRITGQLPSDIDFYVDGILTGSVNTMLYAGEKRIFSACSPYLKPGIHSLKIVRDTYRSDAAFFIAKINLSRAGIAERQTGEDVAQALLKRRNRLAVPASGKISPFNMKGESQFPDLVKINDGKTAVRRTGERTWCADIPLSENGKTSVAAAFENGGESSVFEMEWSATDAVAENGGEMILRKGDSLRLTAAGSGVADGSWTIAVGGSTLSGRCGESTVYKFEEAGTFTVSGRSVSAAGTEKSGSFTVKVAEYSFQRSDAVCWFGWMRELKQNQAGDGVEFEFDGRLAAAEEEIRSNVYYHKFFLDDNKPRYVVASAGGNVLDVQQLSGVGIYSSHQTVMKEVGKLPDGGRLFEMAVVVSPVREDVTLVLDIFVSGVVFEDGTVSKELTASDIGEDGVCTLRFIRPANVGSSTCHRLKVYQNGEYLGIRAQ